MTPGTVAAILEIRKIVAALEESSPGECLAGIAHELGFLIAFVTDRGEDPHDVAQLVESACERGSEAYREASEVAKNAN